MKKLISLLTFALTTSAFAVTDGEIVKTLMTVNNGEISMATMAKKKSKNMEIIKFADHMLTDHKMNKMEAEKIIKAHKIPVTANDKAMAMDKEGTATMAQLEKAQANAFDREYIQAQVKMHKEVLATLENEYIPAAQDADLKALLTKTKDTVAMHVQHAEKIQAEMK